MTKKNKLINGAMLAFIIFGLLFAAFKPAFAQDPDYVVWSNDLESLTGISTVGANVEISLSTFCTEATRSLKIDFTGATADVDYIYFNLSDSVLSGTPPTQTLAWLNFWCYSENITDIEFKITYKESVPQAVTLKRYSEANDKLRIDFTDVAVIPNGAGYMNHSLWNQVMFLPILSSPNGEMDHFDAGVNNEYVETVVSASNSEGGAQYLFTVTATGTKTVYLDFVSLTNTISFQEQQTGSGSDNIWLWLTDRTSLWFGLIGALMCILAPLFMVKAFKDKDPQGFAVALLIMSVVGFCLIIGWLYG